MENWKDYVKLHFIVWIWGFTAVLGNLITIQYVEIVFYRTLLASAALGVLLLYRQRNFKVGSAEIIRMLGTGSLIAFHWILFFGAAKVSTVSVCLAGISTASLWTSLLEPLINRGKIKIFEVALGLVALIGLYVIFQFEFDHALGLVMAIGAALLSSIFTIINGGFSKRHNPYMITFYEMVGACITTVLFFPFYQYLFGFELNLSPQPMDWLYILILAVVCTVYAYSVSVEVQQRLTAFVVNLTVNLEPVYGIMLALIVFKESEQMTPGFYGGTALILLSVLAYPVLNRMYKRRMLKKQLAS
jgi:drug/metabolite transporter (DMT)-like permease